MYTWTSAAAVLVVLALDLMTTRLVLRRGFWVAYAIVLFFQLVVNGLLTGIPVVRYDAARIVGWRVAFAPVEDVLFGFAMVLLTLTLWTLAGRGRPARDR